MGKLLKKIMIGGIIVVLVFGAFVLVGCENYVFNEEDFVLTIYVENATLPQGQNFVATAILQNNSGRTLRYYSPFVFPLHWWVEGNEWVLVADMSFVAPPSQRWNFEADSYLQTVFTVPTRWQTYDDEGYQLPGDYMLKARVNFWLGQRQNNEDFFVISTSPITITGRKNNEIC